MIADVEVAGIGDYTPDEPTKKYIRKKIGSYYMVLSSYYLPEGQ